MRFRGPLFSVLVVAVVAVAGCGGSGSSVHAPVTTTPAPQPPETPEPPAPSPFETEYNLQGGLHVIKANAMHERGGTGQGIIVALFDSGSSDHPEADGLYVYEGEIDIDCDPKPAGEPCRPVDLGPGDTNGHGTFLAGLIAAPRDGAGIVGVAHEARLASVAVHSGGLTDGQYPSWVKGLIPQIDKMIELGAWVTNNSWGSHVGDYPPGPGGLTADEVRGLMPIDKYQEYVDAGGVQVWATGNKGDRDPNVESAAPWYFPDLEKGWLAVSAVNLNGLASSHYSNWCGLASDWCLAAPGAMGFHQWNDNIPPEWITSWALNGGYRTQSGTSLSAPMVAAGIAALKSMFPNLTYHQIRDRILETANEAIFHVEHSPGLVPPNFDLVKVFGHGVLDLDAASSPVGGMSLPLSAFASGPRIPIEGTGANLPPGAVDRYFAGRSILLLDNYQRAPFRIPADAFAVRRGPRLALRDLRLGIAHDGVREAGHAAVAFGETPGWDSDGLNGRARGVLGFGTRVLEEMAAFTGVSGPRDGLYRMTDDALGVALRFASEAGGEVFAGFAANVTSDKAAAPGFGTAGWAPRAVASLTYVPPGAGSSFELSAAPRLKRPMGWDGVGAFAVSGDAYGVSWRRAIAADGAYRVGFAGRLAQLETEAGPLVRFGDATIAAADLNFLLALGERTVLAAGLGMERAVKPVAGRMQLPDTIDESGRIGMDEVRIDGADFLNVERGTLRLHYTPAGGVALSTGMAVVRDGFGDSHMMAGLQAEVAF